MELNLKIHHIGCVVENIEQSISIYKNTLGFKECSKTTYVSSQDVNVCFVKIGENTYMELIEPLNETSAIAKLLKKKQSYYHIGYLTESFSKTLEDLTNKGLHIITTFKSEAFNNKQCAFLYTEEMHMIEIIEV